MAIPAGHIITVGGLHLIDRLQDAGLRDPKVPTETVRETGNDLVVGKILTEANFQFNLTSWDVSCDLMALLAGKKGGMGASEGPSAADAVGTKYKWENCQFVHLASPWAKNTTSEGGLITSGVVIPNFYPSALTYKFGVTSNAEQTVTLDGGAYYMAEAFPQEEFATGDGVTVAFESKELAKVHRIGGFGSTKYRHILGVLVNGVIQQEGVDYVEEGGAPPGEASKKVKIKFTVAPATGAVIRFIYFADVLTKEIGAAAHPSSTVKPAAVRGRNIELLLGPAGERLKLRGIQTFDLSASHTGTVQREMGTYDPIGYNETGIDCNGSFQVDPRDESALYEAVAKFTGIARSEVYGYINEHPIPLVAVIYNPHAAGEVIKSIKVSDALIQLPGTQAKVQQQLSLPVSWESESGTFEEVKGEIAA